ncbi:hypothetical protein NP493_76g03020 [Ridgeia piscesae]|uniref:Uncharacterized protein n=1 Tax=Ridgeia piscesae TaxID=27915 RepID=A0AAD9P9D0_RIDPI|nr:hypothetical protein NP493_76g03020 [Ridgeia piscesae]
MKTATGIVGVLLFCCISYQMGLSEAGYCDTSCNLKCKYGSCTCNVGPVPDGTFHCPICCYCTCNSEFPACVQRFFWMSTNKCRD